MAVLEQLGGGAGPRAFASMTDAERMANQEKWKKNTGYGRRWLVEIVFSSFKRIFGSAVHAIRMENIAKEVALKVFVYNRMIDVAREAMGMA